MWRRTLIKTRHAANYQTNILQRTDSTIGAIIQSRSLNTAMAISMATPRQSQQQPKGQPPKDEEQKEPTVVNTSTTVVDKELSSATTAVIESSDSAVKITVNESKSKGILGNTNNNEECIVQKEKSSNDVLFTTKELTTSQNNIATRTNTNKTDDVRHTVNSTNNAALTEAQLKAIRREEKKERRRARKQEKIKMVLHELTRKRKDTTKTEAEASRSLPDTTKKSAPGTTPLASIKILPDNNAKSTATQLDSASSVKSTVVQLGKSQIKLPPSSSTTDGVTKENEAAKPVGQTTSLKTNSLTKTITKLANRSQINSDGSAVKEEKSKTAELPKHFMQLDQSRMPPRTAAFYKRMALCSIFPSLEALPLTYVISSPHLLQSAMKVWRQFYIDFDGGPPSAVGFDTESTTTIAALRTRMGRKRAIKQLASQIITDDYRNQRLCSLLQISTHECCLLIQLDRIKAGIKSSEKPAFEDVCMAELVDLLQDTQILKVGVGAVADGETVKRTIGVSVAGTVDLDRLAAVRGHAAASLSELARLFAHPTEMPLPDCQHFTEMDNYLQHRLAHVKSEAESSMAINTELDDLNELSSANINDMVVIEKNQSKNVATELFLNNESKKINLTNTAEDIEENDVEVEQERSTEAVTTALTSSYYPFVYDEPPDGQYAAWDWNNMLTPPMIRYATWDAIAGLRILQGLLWNRTRSDYQPLFKRDSMPFSEIVASVCHAIYQNIQSQLTIAPGATGSNVIKASTGRKLIIAAMTGYGWWVRAYPKERRRVWSEQILRMLLANGTIVMADQQKQPPGKSKIVKTTTVVTTEEGKTTTTTTTEETKTIWSSMPSSASALELSQRPTAWLLKARFDLASNTVDRIETTKKSSKLLNPTTLATLVFIKDNLDKKTANVDTSDSKTSSAEMEKEEPAIELIAKSTTSTIDKDEATDASHIADANGHNNNASNNLGQQNNKHPVEATLKTPTPIIPEIKTPSTDVASNHEAVSEDKTVTANKADMVDTSTQQQQQQQKSTITKDTDDNISAAATETVTVTSKFKNMFKNFF
ncbi:hypothetical protein BDF19DRAFT_462491 [Syncephalis fuscata]|nr:hypothetical protein BDF19DRAFT_462491 [Syncephalis fuscata]